MSVETIAGLKGERHKISIERSSQLLTAVLIRRRLEHGSIENNSSKSSLQSNGKKLGQTDNATCRHRKGAEETAEHILCTCDAISLKGLLYLGKANLTPEEVVSQ